MTDNLKEIGRNAYASIVAMVEALECDYARLEELRDARTTWLEDNPGSFIEPNDPRNAGRWAMANPDESEELAELETAANECADREEAEQRILEDALSVEVRSGWASPGDTLTAEEFCILLSTGGPAVRVRGELDEHLVPRRAWLEVQDWGTPWSQYFDASQETLLTYARCFYYGDE